LLGHRGGAVDTLPQNDKIPMHQITWQVLTMKTFFYNRTAYPLLNLQVPKCFIELDEYFDKIFQSDSALYQKSVLLVENLCHRMADVEVHARYISEEQNRDNTFKAAIFIGTLLVGFFTSCKSVLDAGAIALNAIYNLNLPEREQDFGKLKLLNRLKEKTGAVIYNRYLVYKNVIQEIIDWRDSAVHRHTPFCVVHSPGRPEVTTRDKQEIKLANQLDADIYKVVTMADTIQWVEPLHFYNKWHSQLIDFCADICLDIRSQTIEPTVGSY